MKRTIAGLILLLCSPLALAKQTELVDRVPVPIPDGHPPHEVDKDIRAAFGQNQWYLESEAPDRLVMVWDDDNHHVFKVGVSHDEHAVTISYLDSVGMNFEESDGKRQIHPLYNSSVAEVAKDLAQYLDKGVPQGIDPSALRAERMARISGSAGGHTSPGAWGVGVIVTSVDGDSWLLGKKSLKLRPGKHRVDFRCGECMPLTGVTAHLWLVAAPGGHYTGYGEGFDREGNKFKVRIMVYDDATGQPTGGIQGSADEPEPR